MDDDPRNEPAVGDINPSALSPSVSYFARYLHRQGLFIHSFKCQACSIEFALFSWWPDRHTVVNTACPECCLITQKTHWVATISSEPNQAFGNGPEIHQWSPVGADPRLCADSSIFTGLPGEDSGEATLPAMD